jgi:predicted DNA-binding transcriptional regulator AlpA
MSAATVYLPTDQVRARYGHCSHMWVVRRMKDAGFPSPVYFGRRRFWRESDLEAWEAEQIKRDPPNSAVIAREGGAIMRAVLDRANRRPPN